MARKSSLLTLSARGRSTLRFLRGRQDILADTNDSFGLRNLAILSFVNDTNGGNGVLKSKIFQHGTRSGLSKGHLKSFKAQTNTLINSGFIVGGGK